MRTRARTPLRIGLAGMAGLLALCSLLVLSSPASAARSRTYTGVSFGPDGAAGTERFSEFEGVESMAVDQSSGDVYVYDSAYGSERIYKFGPAGEPVDFSSTGTNSFSVEQPAGQNAQIAVAPRNAIGGTAGDIYLAQANPELSEEPAVTVFDSTGAKIGAVGPPGRVLNCGVAVDSTGHLFVAYRDSVSEYAPSANPPVNSDLVQTNELILSGGFCKLAVDASDNLYGRFQQYTDEYQIYKFDGISDPRPTRLPFLSENAIDLTADLGSGILFVDTGGEVEEYAAGGLSRLATFGVTQIRGSEAVGYGATREEVYVADRDTGKIKIFGPPVTAPTVTAEPVSLLSPVEVGLVGSVDPEGTTLTGCFFEYGIAAEGFEEETDCTVSPAGGSEPRRAEATLVDLEPETEYHYRLVAANSSGAERTSVQTFTTPSTVQTEAAHGVTETAATVSGRLFPTTQEPYTSCQFEYEPVVEPGNVTLADCNPKASEIKADQKYHGVSANLIGLAPNHTSYRVRLTAATAKGRVVGNAVVFTTAGEPLVSEVRAADADHHSVTLEATIDPGGFDTTYEIEWGAGPSYGSIAVRGSIASDETPRRISAHLEGLDESATYHYRVVATSGSARSETVSLDHEFETVDACGLPQGRCFELASEREPGPIASPGQRVALLESEVAAQAAERPGAIAYPSESGYPGATRGAEVLYEAKRSPAGWSSLQLSPSITAFDEQRFGNSNSSRTLALSPELSCGVVETNQPIPGTTDRMMEITEAGGKNLYRRNSDGSYTPITTSPPENLLPSDAELIAFGGQNDFALAGMSRDCTRIYFQSLYHYPGAHIADGIALYEWEEGRLQAVGFIPGHEDGAPVKAYPGGDPMGGGGGARYDSNAVSSDGRRIVFNAIRAVGANPEEVGTTGLFVREDGVSTDVSASETAIPDTEPRYQWATPDGSEVFFTAPAGLTDPSSAEGRDLYVYDLDESTSGHHLTDLSADRVEPRADVKGLVGGSADGSRIYFTATGRLVARQGLSMAENVDRNTVSLYLWEQGNLRFVATVAALDTFTKDSNAVSAEVSPDGRYLAFESLPPQPDGQNDLLPDVYLFDASAPREALACVSCVPGGQASVRDKITEQLLSPGRLKVEAFSAPRALVVSAGGPTVIFSSEDALAPGATIGESNLFEWSHGQVFLIAAEPPGHFGSKVGFSSRLVHSLGASVDGSDLYFATSAALNWEDRDGRSSVYDARVGGGFAEPPPGSSCNPQIEGACQAPAVPAPTSSSAQTPTFVGLGNPKKKRCPRGRKRQHGKCKVVRKKNSRGRHHKPDRHHKPRKGHAESAGRSSGDGQRTGK